MCDNGSKDGSEFVAARAGARVVHESERGYGSALEQAFAPRRASTSSCSTPTVATTWVPFAPMVAALRAGADLVMGNRFEGHLAPGAMPWLNRHVGSPLLSWLLNLFFGTSVGDVHCGMRAFTRDAYHRLALKTTGMEFASEMVARAARIKLHIAEVPVDYHPRAGESKLRRYRDGWRHLRFLLMYSPTWLYIIPSVLLFVLGFALLVALAFSPLNVPRPTVGHAPGSGGQHVVRPGRAGRMARHLGADGRGHPRLRPRRPVHQRFLPPVHAGARLGLVRSRSWCSRSGAVGVLGWAADGFPQLDEIRPLLLASRW